MITKEDFYRLKAAKKAVREKKTAESLWTKFKDPIVWFTFVLAVATAGLVYVGYKSDMTLRDTLEANKNTQRAYVGVADMPFPYPVLFEEKVLGWRIGAVYENSGGSETHDLVMHIRYANLEEPLPSGFKISTFTKPKIAGDISRSLAPRLRVAGNAICLSPNDIRNIVEQKKHFYVVAWATYKDRFGNRRITEFCTQVIRAYESYEPPKDYPEFDGRKVQPPAIGYHLCTDHNCADEECIDKDGEASERRDNPEPATGPVPIQPDTFCSAG